MAALTRFSNPELLKLPDCEGLLENGTCSWLRVPVCGGSDCRYYNESASLKKAQARLRSLDEEDQERIARKYYGGTRPWLETVTMARR